MIDPISHNMFSRAEPHGPVILMYHSIRNGRDTPDWPWAVSLKCFREQLDLISASGWETVSLSEMASPTTSPLARTIAITFDDGYVDNLLAFEELQKRKMKGTLFIVTGSIGKEPAWGADGRPKGRLLNNEELRALHSCGMGIGSHGNRHIRFTGLEISELEAEMSVSKKTLEDILGSKIDSLAYPYGAWNDSCEHAAEKAGFHYACTTRPGWALIDHNPLQLRRLTVFNTDSIGHFARKITFASNSASWSDLFLYFGKRIRSKLL